MKRMVVTVLAATIPLCASFAHAGIESVHMEFANDDRSKAVPELDELGAPIAFALIAGIAGIAIERRRRNKK